jgi:hypothetical protein
MGVCVCVQGALYNLKRRVELEKSEKGSLHL